MRPRRVAGTIADVARLFTLALVVPFLAAWIYEARTADFMGIPMPRNALIFLATAFFLSLYWIPIRFWVKDVERDLNEREAIVAVGVGWLALTAFAGLPFLMSGVFTSPIDAWFEAMSGLTTTGATVATSLATVPRSMMVWRATMQAVGGFTIIVLSVAVLSRLTHGGIQSLQAEVPGRTVVRMRPRVRQIARTLAPIYAGGLGALLVILWILFAVQGMQFGTAFYEAVLTSFSTVSTGGFTGHDASIAHYDSWLVELVLIVFMLIAGTNASLIFRLRRRRGGSIFRDPEWRFYLFSFAGSTLVLSGLVFRAGAATASSFVNAVRDASFTAASFTSGTGFTTADYDAWPASVKMLILAMMLTGATAGSTSGGLKHVRLLIFVKVIHRQLRLLLHPRGVIPLRLGDRPLKEETVSATMAFFFAYISLALFGGLALMLTDPLFEHAMFDALVTGASLVGNMGPAMGVTGPGDGYAALMPGSKILATVLMFVGRVEVFAAFLLLNKDSWTR